MTKALLFMLSLFSASAFGQSFAPAAGQAGTTAISKDSSIIVSWATGGTIERGYRDIALPDSGLVSFGTIQNAYNQAEGNSIDVVSLGDAGTALMTFPSSIFNGPGPDFAVFENSFDDDYMELAFVEVSSDGVYFVRFPAISETPTTEQLAAFDYSDCRYIHNLAGKYRQGFGTPFDLQDLINSSGIDLNAITHIRIIDVVGSINPSFGTYDSQGTIINDLYPTPFESGGFDLDGVGVIHQNLAAIEEVSFESDILMVTMYPNPSTDVLNVLAQEKITIAIQDLSGRTLKETGAAYEHQISLSTLTSQILIVTISAEKSKIVRRIIKN